MRLHLPPLYGGEWREVRIVDARDAGPQIAARVDAGQLAPSSPVIAGVHPLGGGYPDAIVAAPITEADARAILAGDHVALADCLEVLEDALDLFRAQIRSGRLN